MPQLHKHFNVRPHFYHPMRVISYLLVIVFVNYLSGCDFGRFDSNEATGFYHKQLSKVYSPDKTKYFTINENGTHTPDAHTQVLLNFKHSGAGIYRQA